MQSGKLQLLLLGLHLEIIYSYILHFRHFKVATADLSQFYEKLHPVMEKYIYTHKQIYTYTNMYIYKHDINGTYKEYYRKTQLLWTCISEVL